MLQYRIGPEIRDYSIGSGFYMRINEDLRKCVVFLGHEDPKKVGGIDCKGTGFLFLYKELPYLVTVGHIASVLGDDPFILRINRVNGGGENIYADQVEWFYHSDKDVDLAVTPCTFNKNKYDALYLPEKLIKEVGQYNIGIGDMCYTIGLFRLSYGIKRNLPIVFTGNIALIPEYEKISVIDWEKSNNTRYIDAFLVCSNSLDGLSGSPVFVRPTTDTKLPCLKSTEDDISGERLAISDVFLIGIWWGAWNFHPDQVLATERGLSKDNRVSLGVGIVIPATKILELLELPEMQKKRADFISKRDLQNAASPESVKPIIKLDNPRHKEDFNSLLTAAAKKKPPADET
jgi:hypothetical protein